MHYSVGFPTEKSQMQECEFSQEGARVDKAAHYKQVLKKAKVAVSGKLHTPQYCAEIIKEGKTDIVVLGRQLICDPYWPKKVRYGKSEEIRHCLYCLEGCMRRLHAGQAIRCAINPLVGYELYYNERKMPLTNQKEKIVIVGGGIAGMQAAITANRGGHDVVLLEKSNHLGGQMKLAGIPPHKEHILMAQRWFAKEVEREGITTKLAYEATIENIVQEKPDAVILANGSSPFVPPIEGIAQSIDSWSVLLQEELRPRHQKVVIIGGGTVGCETANLLMNDNDITILEMAKDVCSGQEPTHKENLLQDLKDAGVNIFTEVSVESVDENKTVLYKDSAGVQHTIESTVVIHACGQRPNTPEMAEQLRDMGIVTYVIGDAAGIGNLRTATRSAFDIAVNL